MKVKKDYKYPQIQIKSEVKMQKFTIALLIVGLLAALSWAGANPQTANRANVIDSYKDPLSLYKPKGNPVRVIDTFSNPLSLYRPAEPIPVVDCLIPLLFYFAPDWMPPNPMPVLEEME